MEKASIPSTYSESDRSTQKKLDVNSTAINTTNTEVSRIDGVVVSQGSSINKLQSDLNLVDAKAGIAINNAATAQTTANTAVTNNSVTANRVDSLESKMTTVENGLATKLDASAITSYYLSLIHI